MMDSKRMFPKCSSFILNIFWLNFLVLATKIECLRLTNMTAPAIQDPRHDMQLHCRFDMGGEELYAVKWYKDDHEFFRYSPAHRPGTGTLQFPVAGVQVESERTYCNRNGCDLLLTNLSRPLSSGAYRCEVSSEAPAFRLASQTHNVTVAALPDEHPKIEGLSDSYLIGSHLIATCTSGFGNPKPTLTWYINEEEVSGKLVKEVPSKGKRISHRLELSSTSTQLKLVVDKKLIKNQASASLQISCVSSIKDLNPSVAPPLKISKNVVILDQNQMINNEKLHWSDDGMKIKSSMHLTLIVCLLTVILKYF